MNSLKSLPNQLTLLRMAMIPLLILVLYLPFSWSHVVAAIIFAIASLTDWLDGHFARKLKQTSLLGAFLDPVADKLLVVSALLMLLGHEGVPYITLPVIVIVGREIVISALREWMAELGDRASVTVNYIGKIKTVFQMVALFLLIAYSSLESYWGILGFILLYLSAILTVWSMVIYISIAWPILIKK